MVRSISCGLRPRPTDSEPCGSKSTSSTLRPNSASEAPRLIVVVVLPTPPFWLHIETTRARPCAASRGSARGRPASAGRSGRGRPRRGLGAVAVTAGSSTGRSKGSGLGHGVLVSGGRVGLGGLAVAEVGPAAASRRHCSRRPDRGNPAPLMSAPSLTRSTGLRLDHAGGLELCRHVDSSANGSARL